MDDYEASAYFNYAFLRIDSDYKIIKGEKYELVSLDGSYRTGVFTREEEYGDYHLVSDDYDETTNIETFYIEREDVIGLIPKVLRDELEGINTEADLAKLENLGEGFSYSYNTYYGGNASAHLNFSMPVRLEQVVATPGKQKNDIVVIIKPYVSIGLQDGVVTQRNFGFNMWTNSKTIYNSEFPKINSLSDFKNYSYEEVSRACMNPDDQGRIIIDDYNSCTKTVPEGSGYYNVVSYYMAQEGEVQFEVENTVNGLAKYNASKNRDLEYKIHVKNVGNAASSDNVITTYVAPEVTVVEDSISDDGVYNKNEHTITWEVDRIDDGETIEFAYNATAPDNVNGKELIGKSSISSTQVLGATFSNNTIVTLDKIVEVINNPETGTMVYIANTNIGMPLSYLIVSVVLICFMLVVFIKKLKDTR